MENFTLICSSFACRTAGSRSWNVEANNLQEALTKYGPCQKCGGSMKEKDAKRDKRK